MFTLICLAGIFQFGGGTIDAAVAKFAEEMKVPTVALAVQPAVRRFSFEISTPDEARLAFGRCVGLVSDGEQAAFGPASLPPPFLLGEAEVLSLYEKCFPEGHSLLKGIGGGTATVKTGADAYVRVADLASAKFGKPLSIHWLVGRCRLAVRAENMPEQDFLRAVAFASVGKLLAGEKSYVLDLDIPRYRKMRIAAALAMAAVKSNRQVHPRREELRCRIEAEALRVATDQQLADIMRIEGDHRLVVLKPARFSTLGLLARDFVRELIDPSPSGVRQSNTMAEHLKSIADLSQVPTVALEQSRVGVRLVGKKPGTTIFP